MRTQSKKINHIIMIFQKICTIFHKFDFIFEIEDSSVVSELIYLIDYILTMPQTVLKFAAM